MYKKLNSCNGPRRTVEEWKQTFRERCSHIKKKATDIYVHCSTTGKSLSDIEEKMLQNISMLIVSGMEMLELGLLKVVICPKRKKMSQLKLSPARKQRKRRPRKLPRDTYHQLVRMQKKYSAILNMLTEALINIVKACERLIEILIKPY